MEILKIGKFLKTGHLAKLKYFCTECSLICLSCDKMNIITVKSFLTSHTEIHDLRFLQNMEVFPELSPLLLFQLVPFLF